MVLQYALFGLVVVLQVAVPPSHVWSCVVVVLLLLLLLFCA